MFQFPPFASSCYWIHIKIIQGSRDQLVFDQSPGLIAVFHALHRLLAPRHPPHALSSLAALIDPLAVLVTRNKIKLRYVPVRALRTGLCNEINPSLFSRRIQRILKLSTRNLSPPGLATPRLKPRLWQP